MNTGLCLKSVVLSTVLLLGCGGKTYSTRFSEPVKDKIKVVAVLPFNDLTQGSDPSSVSRFFAQDLEKLYGVKTVSGDELIRKLNEKWISLEDTSNRFFAYKAAQAVEADAVLYGSILEYKYRRVLTTKGGIHEDPAVCLSARLVDGKTGTVYWSQTAQRASFNVIPSKTDSLTRLTALVVRDLARSMRINKK